MRKAMFELDAELSDKVMKITALGDAEADKGNFDAQIEKYTEAWALIPEPKREWEGGTWIMGGIAESHYQKKNFAEAKRYFLEAANCARGPKDSFIQLRLGQLYYDEGETDLAREHLRQAWQLSEGRQFVGEPKKYRDFLTSKK
jgi:tetratricopeptide (TPR) repeat protein